ncbi:hypothetical protein I4U23_006835 [Adineta vaga]|nr:hypothetical protein I4U23_006835 [Adineta vaga]
MSTIITSYYCSCSTCTQIRTKQSKYSRYINSFRLFFTCFSCLSSKQQQTFTDMKPSTITFRDMDITNKHCSKHDVMIKASRPNFSRQRNQLVRQRVKEANQRWRRMSILSTNLTDFILKNKDLIPFCMDCYENFSLLTFDLCHMCITTAINYQQRRMFPDESRTLSRISSVENEDYISEEMLSFSTNPIQIE